MFGIVVACASPRPWGAAAVVAESPTRTVEVSASRKGFAPDRVVTKVGERLRLRFTRVTATSCAKRVVISLDADHQIRRDLPVDVPVEVTLELTRAGEIGFSCSMAMLGGTIEIRP